MSIGGRADLGFGVGPRMRHADMREALLFTLDGARCAVWRDEISSVEEVGSLHRLPFLRTGVNVLGVIGSRTRTLADLSACLGCAPAPEASRARAFLMSEKEPVQGFFVMSEAAAVGVPPESVIPVPAFLSLPFIEGCLLRDDQAVPVLDLAGLYSTVSKGARKISAAVRALSAVRPVRSSAAEAFRAVFAGGSILALPSAQIAERPLVAWRMLRLPVLPSDVDGVAVFRDRMLPIVDLSRRVSGQSPDGNGVSLEAGLENGAAVALLVDDDRGLWPSSDSRVVDLPLAAQSPWMRSAVVRGGEIAVLADLGAMLSRPSALVPGEPKRQYKPEFAFPSAFGKQAVTIMEVEVLGRRIAIPESEVSDTVPAEPFSPVPLSARIVAGVCDHKGALLPVIDLACLYGETSRPQPDWRMIEVVNGTFRALVLCERVLDSYTVTQEAQRPVPVALPYPVVYGCYTDGDAVRLIFNIEALAVHFEESGVVDMMSSLAPQPAAEVEEVPEPAARPEPAGETAAPAEPEAARPEAAEPMAAAIEAAAPAPAGPEAAPPPAQAARTADQPLGEAQPASTFAWRELEPPRAEIEEPPEDNGLEADLPADIEIGWETDVETPAPPAPAPEAPAAEKPTPAPALETPAALPDLEADIPTDIEIEWETDIETPAPQAQSEQTVAETIHEAAAPAPAPPARAPVEPAAPEAKQASKRTARKRRTWLSRFYGFIVCSLLILAVGAALYVARQHVTPHADAQQSAAVAWKQRAAAAVPAKPAAAPAANAPTMQRAPGTFYIVKEGDTLWDISNRFTGNPLNYPAIAGANRIPNPDLIFPGQQLKTAPTPQTP